NICSFFFFSSRRRHTRFSRDWSSDVCSSDLNLLNSSEENTVFEAAKLLTHWGQSSGFDVLVNLLNENKLDGYIDHRLHGYDDTRSEERRVGKECRSWRSPKH